MAKFLSTDEIYRMWQRELPEGVYFDGSATGSFSTASVRAKSMLLKTAYDNMARVYDNQYPQLADERIFDWELYAFGRYLPGSLTLAERRTKILDRFRLRPGITTSDMKAVVLSIIGQDKTVEIRPWGCDGGVWLLGISQLGIDTYLAGARLVDITPGVFPGLDLCDLSDDTDPILSSDFYLAELQETAYTYEVCIFGYTLTDDERNLMDAELKKYEPARAAHVITDNLDPADTLDGET
jgi:hypothetical protein